MCRKKLSTFSLGVVGGGGGGGEEGSRAKNKNNGKPFLRTEKPMKTLVTQAKLCSSRLERGAALLVGYYVLVLVFFVVFVVYLYVIW